MSKEDISKMLSHPLLLLLITALISQYMIPSITRGWQNHQKEIELKTDIAGQITEMVSTIMMAIQVVEVTGGNQQDYDRAYRDWEIRQAVLGSKVRSYYPDTHFGEDWDAFSEIVTAVYALPATFDPAYRKERLIALKAYFPKAEIAWDALESIKLKEAEPDKYLKAWFGLKKAVLRRNEELNHRILKSPMAMFQ